MRILLLTLKARFACAEIHTSLPRDDPNAQGFKGKGEGRGGVDKGRNSYYARACTEAFAWLAWLRVQMVLTRQGKR